MRAHHALLPALAVLALAACREDEAAPEPTDLHARILGALQSEDVTYLRYTFLEGQQPDPERHELWVDWENERSRLERVFSDLQPSVVIVANGMVYEAHDPPRPIDQSFAEEAITYSHLFQWLLLPEEQSREPLRRVDAPDGIERYTWVNEWRGREGGFCGEIVIELDAESSLPFRSYAEPCPEADAEGRGWVTEYEVIDEISRETVPPDFFDPSQVTG